jgi:hypothetical protein
MTNQLTQQKQQAQVEQAGRRRKPGSSFNDFNQQCQRVLRCTAHAMANSPGGLRYKAGTRPWLEGLSASEPSASLIAQSRQQMLRTVE